MEWLQLFKQIQFIISGVAKIFNSFFRRIAVKVHKLFESTLQLVCTLLSLPAIFQNSFVLQGYAVGELLLDRSLFRLGSEMTSVDSENIPPNNSIPSTPNSTKKGDIDAIRERLSLLRKSENPVPSTPKEQPIQKELGWDSISLLSNPARPRLVDKVKKNSDHPTPWWELLICDLDTYKLNPSEELAKSILRVFEAATRSINKEQHVKHQDYFNIWIGYAKFLE